MNLHAAGDLSKYADGRRSATAAIQKKIDECSAKGGGQVVIPAGTYLCETIVMRSHVSLVLSRGATIKGNKDFRGAYKDIIDTGVPEPEVTGAWDKIHDRAVILAKGVEDIGIYGPGTIDGQANLVSFKDSGYANNDGVRPFGMLFKDCRDVTLKDLHICNAAFWTVRLSHCERVLVDGLRIYSMEYINNDGIDVDARDVIISNCIINSDDDAICLKSDDPSFMVENVCVSNCVLSSNSNAIKLGTASRAGFRNISISNCAIRPAKVSNRRNIWEKFPNVQAGTIAGLAGIAIECVDGGCVERINVSNITMSGITTPVFICLNRRKGVGVLRDVSISNIDAKAESVLPCMVVGIPEAKVQNVSLSNINVVQTGGARAMLKPLKENPKGYPDNKMFGYQNPACGLFLRHVDGIQVDNFKVRLLQQDERPCVVLDDVAGETITGLQCAGTTGKLISE